MSAKKLPVASLSAAVVPPPTGVRPGNIAAAAAPSKPSLPRETAAQPPDLLLVCLQHPFDAVGDSSTLVRAMVPSADGNASHLWQLEAVMEMNPPRVFAGWATRGSFTLDLSAHAVASPAAGAWGDTVRTTTGSGNCRVIVMRDATKPRFSLASGARHAPELPMPQPDASRFLNSDISFELNGTAGLSAGAVATASNKSWSRLIAGSSAGSTGMAFDGKWRQNLAAGDGDATASGAWAFAVMTREDYEVLCSNHGWTPNILD